MTPSTVPDRLTVRPATEADIPLTVQMCARFIDAHYTGLAPYRPDHLTALLEVVLANGGLWVLADVVDEPVGFLAMLVCELPPTGTRTAVECMWWVEPVFRQGRAAFRLLETGEAWARAQGAEQMQVMQPANGAERLAPFYARRGYVPLETTWQKRLGDAHAH